MQVTQSFLPFPVQDDAHALNLEQFRQWLAEWGVSANTARAYMSRLCNFETYMKGFLAMNPAASIEECIFSYIVDCRKNAKASESQRGFCVALKSYCRFRRIPFPQVHIQVEDKPPHLLAPADQQRLLEMLNEHCTDKERGLVSLLLLGGLRTGEVVRANLQDVRFERGLLQLSIRNDRGLIDRILPLSTSARHMLSAWIIERRALTTQDDALFISAAGERVHPNTVRWFVSRVGDMAGITLTPQILRNTFIANLASKLNDWETVASLAGLQGTERVARFVQSTQSVEKSMAMELAAMNAGGTGPLDNQFPF
jgi:integrase/recombinase XerD